MAVTQVAGQIIDKDQGVQAEEQRKAGRLPGPIVKGAIYNAGQEAGKCGHQNQVDGMGPKGCERRQDLGRMMHFVKMPQGVKAVLDEMSQVTSEIIGQTKNIRV